MSRAHPNNIKQKLLESDNVLTLEHIIFYEKINPQSLKVICKGKKPNAELLYCIYISILFIIINKIFLN